MPKAYKSKLKVTLVKRIARGINGQSQRFQQAAGRVIDLTPFIGDGCEVCTDKNIRSPVGAFTVTVLDKPDTTISGIQDSLYGLVEPLDYIEIRMARRPELYGGEPPVIMRGFVRTIRRCETMGAGGRPIRKVVINGMDYGMIPQIYQMFLRADYIAFTGVNYVTENRLFVRTGMFGNIVSANEHMNSCLKLVNGWLAKMIGAAGLDSQVPSKIGSDFSVTEGLVPPFSMQPIEGSLWGLMMNWSDAPWNELFFEDRADRPYLVYRPCPFIDTSGKSILGGRVPYSIDASQPGNKALVLNDADVVSFDLSRTDQNVANFFWVDTVSAFAQDDFNVQSLADGSLIKQDNPNALPSLYGLRKMSARSMQMQGVLFNQEPVSDVVDRLQAAVAIKAWSARRREELVSLNIDNVVWEDGQLDLRGNEMVKPGTFVSIRRGQITSKYYVSGVRHMFAPFQTYKTMISVERGDGFLRRIAVEGSKFKNLPVVENPHGVYGNDGE